MSATQYFIINYFKVTFDVIDTPIEKARHESKSFFEYLINYNIKVHNNTLNDMLYFGLSCTVVEFIAFKCRNEMSHAIFHGGGID